MQFVAGAAVFCAGILVGWVMVKTTYEDILHTHDDKDDTDGVL